MNINLNDKYLEMLEEIMKDPHLDQEDSIKYLISFYYKSQIKSNEVA